VAITEAAFYVGLDLQERMGTTLLGQQHTLRPLLHDRWRLWSFQLKSPPTVIDLEDPMALQVFGHPPYILRNPSFLSYHVTQELSNAIFNHPANLQGRKRGA
jgi:hypothetical protein